MRILIGALKRWRLVGGVWGEGKPWERQEAEMGQALGGGTVSLPVWLEECNSRDSAPIVF